MDKSTQFEIEIMPSRRGFLLVIGKRPAPDSTSWRRSGTAPEVFEAAWYWTDDNKWSMIEWDARTFANQFNAENFMKMNLSLMCGGK